MRSTRIEPAGQAVRRTGPGGRTARQPGTLRKQQIADVALEIIGLNGLHRFTAKEIGRSLGISDAAIFRHLPSKKAVIRAAIDRVEQLLFEGFPPDDVDPMTRLGKFFCQRARTIAGRPGFARLMFSEDLAYAGEPEDNERVQGFKRRSAAFVCGCLSEARARHTLPSGIGVHEASLLVMGALMAFLFASQTPETDSNLRRNSERLWRTLEVVLSQNRRFGANCRKADQKKEKRI
jgi:AcrR family transcriptional regulator